MQEIINERRLIRISNIVSVLFSPFYAPLWAYLAIFFFSYLRMLPLGYKLFIMAMVWLFTVLIPRAGINIFRLINKWTHLQLSKREHRHTPYVLTLLSYTTCLFVMTEMNVALSLRGVVMAALVSQIIGMVVNVWWKISTHMMGIGGLVGYLIAFSLLFRFNPVWWTCLLILLAGLVGTSRMTLRQHTLGQVLAGFFVGYLCALSFVLLSWL